MAARHGRNQHGRVIDGWPGMAKSCCNSHYSTLHCEEVEEFVEFVVHSKSGVISTKQFLELSTEQKFKATEHLTVVRLVRWISRHKC